MIFWCVDLILKFRKFKACFVVIRVSDLNNALCYVTYTRGLKNLEPAWEVGTSDTS